MVIQFSQQPFIEKTSPSLLRWGTHPQDRVYEGLFLGSLFPFHWYICLSLGYFHTFLMTIALCRFEISNCESFRKKIILTHVKWKLQCTSAQTGSCRGGGNQAVLEAKVSVSIIKLQPSAPVVLSTLESYEWRQGRVGIGGKPGTGRVYEWV